MLFSRSLEGPPGPRLLAESLSGSQNFSPVALFVSEIWSLDTEIRKFRNPEEENTKIQFYLQICKALEKLVDWTPADLW